MITFQALNLVMLQRSLGKSLLQEPLSLRFYYTLAAVFRLICFLLLQHLTMLFQIIGLQGPTEKEQIDVQGDIAYDIVEFITDTWPDVRHSYCYQLFNVLCFVHTCTCACLFLVRYLDNNIPF